MHKAAYFPTFDRSQTTNARSVFKEVVVGGLRTAIASRAELVEAWIADCRAQAESGFVLRPRLVFDSNAHALSLRETDPAYRAALDQADIVHADGGLIVAASRLLAGRPIPERSCTTDMFYDFAAAGAEHNLSFYLLGGTEEVNAACAGVLARDYPGLRIVGRHHGYFGRDDEERVIDEINAARPDVLWVGLGKPLEQTFSARNADRLRAGWIVSCGGCFNYATGHYPRAPEWMRNNSLEWLHRALTGPRRLIWRYLFTNPHAAWLALVKSGV